MLKGSVTEPPGWIARRIARRAAERVQWEEHLAAMDEGHFDKAGRLARKALGIHGEPMSAETKQLLASPEYKEKAAARRAEKAEIAKRLRIGAATNNHRKR